MAEIMTLYHGSQLTVNSRPMSGSTRKHKIIYRENAK